MSFFVIFRPLSSTTLRIAFSARPSQRECRIGSSQLHPHPLQSHHKGCPQRLLLWFLVASYNSAPRAKRSCSFKSFNRLIARFRMPAVFPLQCAHNQTAHAQAASSGSTPSRLSYMPNGQKRPCAVFPNPQRHTCRVSFPVFINFAHKSNLKLQ